MVISQLSTYETEPKLDSVASEFFSSLLGELPKNSSNEIDWEESGARICDKIAKKGEALHLIASARNSDEFVGAILGTAGKYLSSKRNQKQLAEAFGIPKMAVSFISGFISETEIPEIMAKKILASQV